MILFVSVPVMAFTRQFFREILQGFKEYPAYFLAGNSPGFAGPSRRGFDEERGTVGEVRKPCKEEASFP
jgi:hypothetical protein